MTTAGQDFTITKALPQHEAAIRAQSDATHSAHRARLPHIFAPENSYQQKLLDLTFDAKANAGPSYRSQIYVACRGDDLLAYALVIWNLHEEGAALKTAMVADIAVLEHARGQGIAQALLAHLQSQMHDNGWGSLVADVWDGNDRSHKLFQDTGYAAERTEYRFGMPEPMQDTPAPDNPARPLSPWMIAMIVVIVIAIIASMP